MVEGGACKTAVILLLVFVCIVIGKHTNKSGEANENFNLTLNPSQIIVLVGELTVDLHSKLCTCIGLKIQGC